MVEGGDGKSRIFKANSKPTPFNAKQVRSIEYFSLFLKSAVVTPIQLPSAEIKMNELPKIQSRTNPKPRILMSTRL